MAPGGMVLPIIAKIELQVQGQPIGKATGLLFTDILLIVGAALVLLSILVIWAKYLRKAKPKKHRKGGQKVYRESESATETENEAEAAAAREEEEVRKRYKYRYRRRDHRVRNPTLAETGGLPPDRPQGPAGSQP